MSAKRPRVTVELPEAGQAALPAVCYLPSMLPDTTQEPSTSSNAAAQSAAKRLKYTAHAKSRAGNTTQLVHASLGDIEYVGRSDGDENAELQPCQYALAVYTPGAGGHGPGKLQLVGVAGQRPFRLDSRLSGLIYAPTGAGAEEDASAREMRRLAAKRLVDEFGSTRRRRQLNAREAGVVAADKISGGGAVQEMLGGVAARGQGEGLTREEMEKRAFSSRTVPPHDPSATAPAAAYPLRLLLGPAGAAAQGAEGQGADCTGELNVVQLYKLIEDPEEMAKAREKEWLDAYVLDRLPALAALKSSADPAAAPRAKQRARYLALLALLLRAQSKPVLRSVSFEDVSKELRCNREALQGLLLARFYTRTSDPLRGERYERTDAQKALLLSYILAVAVVAEEGYLQPEEFTRLRAALKLDAPKLSAALQQLGCAVKPVKIKVERDGLVAEEASCSVSLLRPDPRNPDRTLADCFPAIKLARGKGKGR